MHPSGRLSDQKSIFNDFSAGIHRCRFFQIFADRGPANEKRKEQSMDKRKEEEVFYGELQEEVRRRFPKEYLVEIHEVVKNNGVHKKSLIVRGEDRRASPNFYLSEMYGQFQQGVTVQELAEKIVLQYRESIGDCEEMAREFPDGDVKDKIVLRLASGKWNQGFLEEVPHVPFLDMVILFYVVLRIDGQGVSSVRVTNHLQEQWQFTTREMMEWGMENTRRLFPEKMGGLLHFLWEQASPGEQGELSPFLQKEQGEQERGEILVITNTHGINGATAILYPDVLKRVSDMLGGDYFLLPSSIHEFLAVPCGADVTGRELEQMVREVNSTCVAQEELLSDCVYRYQRHTEKISVWGEGK